MTFIITSHRGPHGLLVVIVDKEIVGKIFQEDNKELSVKGKFFEGIEKTKKETIPLLISSRHLHLTGKEIIELALNLELINPEKIIWVQNIPHAQVVSEV